MTNEQILYPEVRYNKMVNYLKDQRDHLSAYYKEQPSILETIDCEIESVRSCVERLTQTNDAVEYLMNLSLIKSHAYNITLLAGRKLAPNGLSFDLPFIKLVYKKKIKRDTYLLELVPLAEYRALTDLFDSIEIIRGPLHKLNTRCYFVDDMMNMRKLITAILSNLPEFTTGNAKCYMKDKEDYMIELNASMNLCDVIMKDVLKHHEESSRIEELIPLWEDVSNKHNALVKYYNSIVKALEDDSQEKESK